jgi:hypothetical protein
MLSDISKINRHATRVRPENRQIVTNFIESHEFLFVDILLAGLNDHETFHGSEWNQATFNRFKSYMEAQEKCISETLEKFSFHIEEDSLAIISQSGRPEIVCHLSWTWKLKRQY